MRPNPAAPDPAEPDAAAAPPAGVPDAEPEHVDREAVLVAVSADPGADEGPGAQIRIDEPWPGYGELNVKQVNAQLADAGPGTLALVRLYESANRNRSTVLDAIDRRLAAVSADAAAGGEEALVQARVAAELGMKRDREQRRPAARRPAWPSTDARISTPSPCAAIHGARMKTARSGGPSSPAIVEVGLERAHLAPERVAPRLDVHDPEVLAVEHDQPRARAEDRRAGRASARSGSASPSRSMPERHRRRLAAGDDEPVEPVEVGRHAHLAHVGAERAQHPRVRREAALQGEHADRATPRYQPRWASSCSSPSERDSSESIAAPSPSEARATRSGRRSASSPRRSPARGARDRRT